MKPDEKPRDNPPWTMFFEGPLYQKYDEFMRHHDLSKILQNKKLQLDNTNKTVEKPPGKHLDPWEDPNYDKVPPVRSVFKPPSMDSYEYEEEKRRRRRRTCCFTCSAMLVIALLSLATGLVIHYVFIEPKACRLVRKFSAGVESDKNAPKSGRPTYAGYKTQVNVSVEGDDVKPKFNKSVLDIKKLVSQLNTENLLPTKQKGGSHTTTTASTDVNMAEIDNLLDGINSNLKEEFIDELFKLVPNLNHRENSKLTATKDATFVKSNTFLKPLSTSTIKSVSGSISNATNTNEGHISTIVPLSQSSTATFRYYSSRHPSSLTTNHQSTVFHDAGLMQQNVTNKHTLTTESTYLNYSSMPVKTKPTVSYSTFFTKNITTTVSPTPTTIKTSPTIITNTTIKTNPTTTKNRISSKTNIRTVTPTSTTTNTMITTFPSTASSSTTTSTTLSSTMPPKLVYSTKMYPSTAQQYPYLLSSISSSAGKTTLLFRDLPSSASNTTTTTTHIAPINTTEHSASTHLSTTKYISSGLLFNASKSTKIDLQTIDTSPGSFSTRNATTTTATTTTTTTATTTTTTTAATTTATTNPITSSIRTSSSENDMTGDILSSQMTPTVTPSSEENNSISIILNTITNAGNSTNSPTTLSTQIITNATTLNLTTTAATINTTSEVLTVSFDNEIASMNTKTTKLTTMFSSSAPTTSTLAGSSGISPSSTLSLSTRILSKIAPSTKSTALTPKLPDEFTLSKTIFSRKMLESLVTVSTLPTTRVTTETPTTLPPIYNVVSMHDVTAYTFENTKIHCDIKVALKWTSVAIKGTKGFRPLELKLFPNGEIKWRARLTRHKAKYLIEDGYGDVGNNVTLDLIIDNVQCRDGDTYTCILFSEVINQQARNELTTVGKPGKSIRLSLGPSIIENRAIRLTVMWDGGYPIPWTNVTWTAVDKNNNSYDLSQYGQYREFVLQVDHSFCQTRMKQDFVIFPKMHLNGTTIIVKPDMDKKKSFVNEEMTKELINVEPGIQSILVIPLDYCPNNKEEAIPHPYENCKKFVWCLPGDLVVQQCPFGTCFHKKLGRCLAF